MIKMVNVKESEQLGNAINILEALNGLLLKMTKRTYSANRKVFICIKIEKVIEFMDGVIC